MKKTKKIKRRVFLKTTGAVSAATITGCQKIKNTNKAIHNFLNIFEETIVPKGIETWKTTTCTLCSSACGIRVRTIEGRVVKIEGNILHPVNRGGICPRGVNGIQQLYNPDRISGPMIRKNSGKNDLWEKVSWNDALKIVTDKLISLRSKSPQSLMFIHGEPATTIEKQIVARFMKAYGSPNYLQLRDDIENYDNCTLDAVYLMQGIESKPVYDIGNSNFVISFNTDIFESHENLMQSLRAYGNSREKRQSERCRFVHIGPRLSATASTADKWIPVKPGKEGILALGLAHVLIREDLYDYNFVKNSCRGFEDETDEAGNLKTGFKRAIMSGFTPEDVSAATGVKIEEIISTARRLGASKPSLAIGKRGDVMTQMAVHSLNALLGSINTRGGILFPSNVPLTECSSVELDDAASAGLSKAPLFKSNNENRFFNNIDIAGLLENITSSSEPPIEALMVKNANPLYSSTERKLWEKALEKIPFKISFSEIMDETSMLCDVILPDCSYLEKWSGSSVSTSEGYQTFSLSKPALEPVADCKPYEDVLISIASSISPSCAKSFPWKNSMEYVDFSIEGLFNAGRGSKIGEEFEGTWIRLLEKAGWRIPAEGGIAEFKKNLIEAGGWWDPIYYYGEFTRVILTASGKFDFMPLSKDNQSEPPEKKEEISYESLKAKEAKKMREYSFPLHVSKPIALAGLRNPNAPWLMDNITPVVTDRWGTWVEINTEVAKEMGIEHGDELILESENGKIRVRASLTKGIHKECVSVPSGMGHTSDGEWSKGIGINVCDIITAEYDSLTGLTLTGRTIVKVYKG